MAGTLFAGSRQAPGQSSDLRPIPETHFPDRLHLFVWRNWELVNLDRMARVLGTSQKRVLELGDSMGLPPKPRLTSNQLRRIYISVIRQNWHILPEDQLIQLLGWDRTRFAFTLREDDFLDIKLGGTKPRCDRLSYQIPSPQTRQRAREIKRLLERVFGESLTHPGEAPCHFVQELSSLEVGSRRDPQVKLTENHIDLTGYTFATSGRSVKVRELIQDFRTYLESALDCATRLSDASSPMAPENISLSVDPSSGAVAESFEIHCRNGSVEVVSPSFSGLRQAVYHMQELLEERAGPFLPTGTIRKVRRLNPTYLYSYFALYGDPLMEPEIDPFPEGYLDKLGRVGVNGVWLQAVLRNLAPSHQFPEFGKGWETRLSTLRQLVERADRFGIKLYLYLNEPRAMPAEFFDRHPDIKGTHQPSSPEFFAMCTSVPRVREWMADSLSHIFSQVPGLGGTFTITMSENLTNCYAKGQARFCPRCPNRNGWEVVSEVIQTVRRGVRRGSDSAEVIAWDWGWGEDWVRNGADAVKVIQTLPSDVRLMSISEWDQKVTRGGFSTEVGEYSMSVVGPGPRARRHWTAARQRGLETMAKVQVNSTWEISAVPYIPVPNLVQEHLSNLVAEGLDGLMLSWTVGGFPSPNLQVAKESYYWPNSDRKDALQRIAALRYGKQAASLVLKAWNLFSQAFQEFPYGVSIYTIPTQHGPANLLRLVETGHGASMILFPHDDLKRWVGPYPVEIVHSQFAKLADAWKPGLMSFRQALDLVPENRSAQARKDLGIAETCHLHFRSVANQVRFYMLREELAQGQGDRKSLLLEMKQLTRDEMEAARSQYRIARQDSTIGFEATNHYYYRPLDLAEKVVNCDQILNELERG